MSRKDAEPTNDDIKKMMKEYGVETEEELQEKLLEDWNRVECFACGRKIKLEKAVIIDEVPYCRNCA